MEWHEINSSAIGRYEYDDLSMTLTVEFVHGGIYRYFDVPKSVVEAMVSAESVGQFFATEIKPTYRCSKV